MAKKITILLICIFIIPTVVFADSAFSEDQSYEVISDVSVRVLNILSWFGYAIALRNFNMGWNEIYAKYSKRKS